MELGAGRGGVDRRDLGTVVDFRHFGGDFDTIILYAKTIRSTVTFTTLIIKQNSNDKIIQFHDLYDVHLKHYNQEMVTVT